MAWASPADLIQRKDSTLIGQLASDDSYTPAPADLLTNQNVLTALDDASGDIESALFVAQRYSTDDLAGLAGTSLSLLKRITCDLAMAYLYDRRPLHDVDALERYSKLKRIHLERLSSGENVFSIPAKEQAGLPASGGMTVAQYDNANFITERTPRFFPSRGSRLPLDRG